MELLIKARDANHPDPDEDARGCYKRGDPVVLMPDGHRWGRCEAAPAFWRLRLEGAPRHVLQPFVEPQWSGIWIRGHSMPRQQVRRRWTFMPELLAAEQRMALFRGDVLPLDWSAWLRCLHDKSQQRGRGLILKVA